MASRTCSATSGTRRSGTRRPAGCPLEHHIMTTDHKGILSYIKLPQKDLGEQWDKIIVAEELKDRLLAQAILEFTVRGKVSHTSVPLHGVILLKGPPGTGKTSLARGLANRVAESLSSVFHFIEVEPHALASAALGRSQQAVRDLP